MIKKICMLTTSPLDNDSRILIEAEILSHKYDLTVLTKKYEDRKETLKNTPFKFKRIKYQKFSQGLLNILSSLFALSQAAFRESPDVFHAHDLDGLLCGFLPALLKKTPLVYDSHELWTENFPYKNQRGIRFIFKPLERILMLKVRRGITVNQSIAKYLKKKYSKEFLPLYNYLDTSARVKAQLSLRKEFPGKKIVLHLGSADEGRGFEQMLAAAAFLSKDAVLVFVGGGKLANLFQEKVAELHLEGKAYFLPAVRPDEIYSVVKEADLGLALTQKISLSYYYSSPNKLFQYLASGVPVLGSNFPEFKKVIVQNKIGEVVDPKDVKLIAAKIKEMLKNSNQKKYRKNLQGLENRYTWENQQQKLLDFYQSLN